MADRHAPPPGRERAAPVLGPDTDDDGPEDGPLESLGKAVVDPIVSTQPETPADKVHERNHPEEKKR